MLQWAMHYFAAQVKTNGEEFFISEAAKSLLSRDLEGRFFFPKRKLLIRRGGKLVDEVKAIFPGYIFLEAEAVDPELYALIRRVKGFYRFLKSNREITPLSGSDLSIIAHFLSFGGVADTSKIYFDENDKIVVTEGPMKGLEGLIVKVDRRKKRVKLRLDFCRQQCTIDLAFEVIEKVGPKPEKAAAGHENWF